MISSNGLAGSQTPFERIDYGFDNRGLFHCRSFLSQHDVEEARQKFDALDISPESWAPNQYRASNIHLNPFQNLARSLHEHAITRRLIGYPPRLLESYAINRTAGALDLHGGASEYLINGGVRDISAQSWVHEGRLYTLRLKVLIYLDEIMEAEDGLLLYVEGSHKSAFAFHRAFGGGRDDAKDLVRHIEVRAGDAIWLNEALLHGAGEKTSDRKRRVLAFTFGPAFMANWTVLETSSLSGSGYFGAETERR